MDENKGRDMGKVVLGIILILAGNFLALNGFPKAKDLPASAGPTKTLSGASLAIQYHAQSEQLKLLNDQLGVVEVERAKYFKLLMLSLCLVSLGGFSLLLSAPSANKS